MWYRTWFAACLVVAPVAMFGAPRRAWELSLDERLSRRFDARHAAARVAAHASNAPSHTRLPVFVIDGARDPELFTPSEWMAFLLAIAVDDDAVRQANVRAAYSRAMVAFGWAPRGWSRRSQSLLSKQRRCVLPVSQHRSRIGTAVHAGPAATDTERRATRAARGGSVQRRPHAARDRAGGPYELTDVAGRTRFDIDANGVTDAVAWPRDGRVALLFYDRTGNGMPDNGAELFGNATKLSNCLAGVEPALERSTRSPRESVPLAVEHRSFRRRSAAVLRRHSPGEPVAIPRPRMPAAWRGARESPVPPCRSGRAAGSAA